MKAFRKNNHLRANRQQKGSVIAETGPAFFLLFIFFFFPMLDLISMPIFYCSCATLNDVQLREAVNLKKSMATDPSGPVKKNIPSTWSTLGVGKFVGLSKPIVTDVSYSDGVESDIYVTVSTTITCRPFLTIPFFVGVPGMSTDQSYTISTKRLLENPHNFNS